MMKFLHSALLMMVITSTSQLTAAPLKITTGSVTFLATGKPGFLKINGTGPDVTGDLDKSATGITGTVTVQMDKFASGIDMRDEHMKEKYLEVKKFPIATLKITELPFKDGVESQELPFKGKLDFHGVDKSIEGVAVITNAGGAIKVDAKFPMTISDYKIEIPSYAGIKVADKVEVQALVNANLSN